ncbi:alpha-L-fucosidase [Rhizomicrobium palustre]|uniref:alpha-L-fucosidase n=1 Tax=Rhizomicrobium palustre TaxID=189966 RepID=A0A846MW98_9PROT|nr:alpha-L-fucosidase [Rhizomicrobium palustre]NIK87666.1 alpha-L-fucosidase [Rhizomicrobium palustre]
MTKISKRTLFKAAGTLGLAAALPAASRAEEASGIAGGPFRPNWESLVSGYQTPEWFRDAKFGLWAHWGPQCVPEAGDWYARQMYVQGNGQYDQHVAKFGHPADTGFMDVIGKWKAEKFDPDALLNLYKRAGAKYFVALANHHDNFDTFNSKHHAWNATRIGPKRDLIGAFAKAARARGLKFGVSNHSAHAWHWFQTAYGYDLEGPRKAERYDAFKLTKEMGKGKWWEGLDPQELYAGRVMAMPDGIPSIAEANKWHEMNDRVWDEYPPIANPEFVRRWFLRCKDLIDSYQPDLLYFDNFDLPLGQAGLDIAAHYYNASIAWHGKLEAVLNFKAVVPQHRGAAVEDVERGFRADIEPKPWQTDTCIGDWHYSRPLYEKNGYKSAASVIHRLCDVVSKNGNLLLSVPVRGDGSIDEKETAIVEGVAGWMARFSEAIHGTRPWIKAGEGPTQVASGQFGEAKEDPFSAEDIRFTTKAGALYAITLGKPQTETITVKSLASAKIERVEVVGAKAPLAFRQDTQGLHITLPARASHDYGLAFKIRGKGLV